MRLQQHANRRLPMHVSAADLATLLFASWLVSGEVLAQVAPLAASDPATAVRETMLDDAALAAVSFIDEQTGWAVGDRGVVWHTRDGGHTWDQQNSGVSCRLSGVFFLDAHRGWAVGGSTRPHTRATQGVVLRTEDGGENWTAVPTSALPTLAGVRLFDAKRGVAFGRSSAALPAGVFITSDGGTSWRPLSTDRRGDWLAGDFVDADTGATAGPAGTWATVVERHVTTRLPVGPTSRSFHALRLLPPVGGWLVGDGGLVMTTRDLGHSWQTPRGNLPDDAAEHFDFYAVAAHGEQVWIAGSPGTRVFHSPDGGRTWHAFATGQTVPLRAIAFVDDRTGWAVGDLGTILSTADGGRSWHAQRAGGHRAALLAVVARTGDVPLELVTQLGAEEGYLTAIDVLHHDVTARGEPADTTAAEVMHEAVILAGATIAEAAWRFPLPPREIASRPDELLAALNRVNDGRAIERLESHLVARLRMWRPDVVVTHHADQASEEPLAALVQQLVMRAVEAAGDPTQYTDMAAGVGLEPWQVKKVYGLLPPGNEGEERIATGRFEPRLGCTLADWATPARGLLEPGYAATPESFELKLLFSRMDEPGGGRDVFRGIVLVPGGDARRRLAGLSTDDVAALRQMASRHRHLQALLERTAGDAAWVGQVVNLTDGLDARRGSQLLFQLAEGYRAKGQFDLAADTYYLLARRWPDQPLVDQALVWLVQFYASSEAAQRSAGHAAESLQNSEMADSERLPHKVEQAAATAPIDPAASPSVGVTRDDRLRRAVLLGKYLETARPSLYAEPAVRLPLIVAQRQLGYANPAKRYFLTLGRLPESDPWRACAETERWLAAPDELPPTKKLGNCRPARERPHLDGRLDEPFWQSADVLRLRESAAAPDGAQMPEVRLAYDKDFLYVAVCCAKINGVRYVADDRPRPHDADLAQHDRVLLKLDVDRDYTTCFEFEIDDRGWTREACWGDPTWNPSWFVAAASDETSWTVEAAIPLGALVDQPPDARNVWAVALRRTIPGIGCESWSGRATSADDSPDQFGLLIFE